MFSFQQLLIFGLLSFSYGSSNTTITKKQKEDACTECPDLCVLLPPPERIRPYPCYQGKPADVNECWQNDPVLPEYEIYKCGVCADYGYPYYYGSKPLFRDLDIWTENPTDKF